MLYGNSKTDVNATNKSTGTTVGYTGTTSNAAIKDVDGVASNGGGSVGTGLGGPLGGTSGVNTSNLRMKTLDRPTDNAIMQRALSHPDWLTIGSFIKETNYPIPYFQYNLVLSQRNSDKDVTIPKTATHLLGYKNKKQLCNAIRALKLARGSVSKSGDEITLSREVAKELFYHSEAGRYFFKENFVNLVELWCKYTYMYVNKRCYMDGETVEV